MEKVNLFDKDLLIKNELCSDDLSDFKEVRGKLRLYIKATDFCNAGCLFCANNGSMDFGEIDLEKLDYVIRYLVVNERLNGISITGGEPLTSSKLFEILDLIYRIDKSIEVQISTNGYNLLKLLDYDNINNLESVHISRHHYNDEINYDIFGTDSVASLNDIAFFQEGLTDKRIVNINTIVMKDYICDLEEIKKMLDSNAEAMVYKTGFVSLMRCNDYCDEKFINFNDIFNCLDESFLLGHHFYCRDYCECLDGVYLTRYNKLISFYARMVKDLICPYTTQLVYTSDNKLTAGFGKQLILK